MLVANPDADAAATPMVAATPPPHKAMIGAEARRALTPGELQTKNKALFDASNSPSDTLRLLAEGADPDGYKDPDGYTVMTHAARIGSQGVVEMLIHAGGDVNHASTLGNTALIVVVSTATQEASVSSLVLSLGLAMTSRSLLAMARLLLDNGADVNHANENGATALYLALVSKKGQWKELATLLRERGAHEP